MNERKSVFFLSRPKKICNHHHRHNQPLIIRWTLVAAQLDDEWVEVPYELMCGVIQAKPWIDARMKQRFITVENARVQNISPTFLFIMVRPYGVGTQTWRRQQDELAKYWVSKVKPSFPDIHIMYIIPRLRSDTWTSIPEKDELLKPYIVLDVDEEGFVSIDMSGRNTLNAIAVLRQIIQEDNPQLPAFVWWKRKKVVGLGLAVILIIILGVVLMSMFIWRRRR
jgi:hypothetical protein